MGCTHPERGGECSCLVLEVVEGGYHGGEDSEKEPRDFLDRSEGEVVPMVNPAWRQEP